MHGTMVCIAKFGTTPEKAIEIVPGELQTVSLVGFGKMSVALESRDDHIRKLRNYSLLLINTPNMVILKFQSGATATDNFIILSNYTGTISINKSFLQFMSVQNLHRK